MVSEYTIHVCIWTYSHFLCLSSLCTHAVCHFSVNCISCFTCVTASEYCLPLLCLQGAGALGLHCPLDYPSEATGVQILYPSLPLCEVSISLWPQATHLNFVNSPPGAPYTSALISHATFFPHSSFLFS